MLLTESEADAVNEFLLNCMFEKLVARASAIEATDQQPTGESLASSLRDLYKTTLQKRIDET